MDHLTTIDDETAELIDQAVDAAKEAEKVAEAKLSPAEKRRKQKAENMTFQNKKQERLYKTHDIGLRKTADLRDVLKTSANKDLVGACRSELDRRLKVSQQLTQRQKMSPKPQGKKWLAGCDYQPPEGSTDKLPFEEGDVLLVTVELPGGWWFARLGDREGWIPSDFLDPLPEADEGSDNLDDLEYMILPGMVPPLPPRSSKPSTSEPNASPVNQTSTTSLATQRTVQGKITAAVSSLAGADGVPYNSVMCVSIGPGGTGKTAMRLAMQGKPLPKQRESTQGGDLQQLVVHIGQMLDFAEVEAGVSQIDRAVLMQLRADGAKAAAAGDLASVEELQRLVSRLADAHVNIKALDEKTRVETMTTVQEVVVVRSSGSGSGSGHSSMTLMEAVPTSSRPIAQPPSRPPSSTKPTHLKVEAEPSLNLPPIITEQIHFTKDEEITLASRMEELEKRGVKEGVHITFFDMGGQPEFASIAAEFLRSNAIISVFSRLDELHHNITKNAKLVGDSEREGIDELFVWLDAVAARTTDGPVLLVFTHADKLNDKAALKHISLAVQQRLNDQEHPVRARLVPPPNSDLIFFVVDNTKGLKDAGVNAYRETVKKLAETSPSALQKVPLQLLKLQDAVAGLSREPSVKDSAVMKRIRTRYPNDRILHRITLPDLAALYEEATGVPFDSNLADTTFRTYLDFFNMLGVVTHSNLPFLEDLIIINPLWLLKQITTIIRRPSLHPLPVDNQLVGLKMDTLYKRGILELETLKLLWSQHSEKLQVELLNLCLQGKKYLVPALLPDRIPAARFKADVQPTVVHLAFYTGKVLLDSTAAEKTFLKRRCHLPSGLFEQILSGLTRLSFGSQLASFSPIFSRHYAFLLLGRYEVEVVQDDSSNTICVKVYMKYAETLLLQIRNVVGELIKERFFQLEYELLAPFDNDVFVQVKAVQDFWAQSPQPWLTIQQQKLQRSEVERVFGGLLQASDNDGSYHVFISYRCVRKERPYNCDDSEATAKLYNALSSLSIGAQGEAMKVFYDLHSLREGEQFNIAFMRAMSNTLAVVPVVTSKALERMCDESNLAWVDNVLLEWWLALTLLKAGVGRIKAVLPVFCGEITNLGTPPSIANLFSYINKSADELKKLQDAGQLPLSVKPIVLPDKINQPTLHQLQVFITKELDLSADIVEQLTVRQIVEEMKLFNASSTLCWVVLHAVLQKEKPTSVLATTSSLNAAIQQVFAYCAEPVRLLVEKKLVEEAAGSKNPSSSKVAPPAHQPSTSSVMSSTSAVSIASSALAPTLQGLKPDLSQFLVNHQLDANDSLVNALRELEIKSMSSLQSGILDGLVTVEELKANGAKAVPASQFLKVAKKHFGLQ